ncbi:unnamed protein product [Diatraea saccharalis]|uniref:Uncharacterized protein n=1 Tax=Diatraea saccharalis TaxID=40085 RepID=A0A9N9R0C2_9NEOP|nr:unnamed protein product [Diatraea saccharalis]
MGTKSKEGNKPKEEKQTEEENKKRNTNEWQNNKNKLLNNSGQSYTGVSSKRVYPSKSIRDLCKCKKKCCEKFNDKYRKAIFESYWRIGYCYVWHYEIDERGAIEIGSCLLNFIEDEHTLLNSKIQGKKCFYDIQALAEKIFVTGFLRNIVYKASTGLSLLLVSDIVRNEATVNSCYTHRRLTRPSRSMEGGSKSTVAKAKNARWVQTPRPEGPMPELVLYCPSTRDRTLCVLYDDSSYVAGLQIALDQSKFRDGIFDWETQGFTVWNPPVSVLDTPRTYQTIQQYFISEDQLKVSVHDRIVARNKDTTLQFGSVWVTGFNKQRMRISTIASEIADTPKTHFTKQACIPNMGRHYYYNMTATTECTATSLLPWFPLVHSGELIGMGAVIFGKLNEKDLVKDYFERPNVLAVKTIVPDGPQCLYDLAASPAMITMHSYYINTPWLVDCLFQ